MNAAQTSLYFREWGNVRKHYLAQGIDSKLVDAKRHELHKRALGEMKSSKAFTNLDLDKVLAVFYAITRPSDLNAQLRQQDQAAKRFSALLADCQTLASQCVSKPGLEGLYLDGMARKIFGPAQYHLLDEKQLAALCGILRKRIAQLNRSSRSTGKQTPGELSASAKMEAHQNPF